MFTGCTCQIDQAIPNNALSYVISGSTLTEVAASTLGGTSMDYCIVGNTMTQRRSLPPGTDYIITYTRR
jgi:hypothetical protein